MGEAIISRRGGGKLFAVIDVSYPAGAVCTCSNGTRTLKARGTGGHFLFNIPTAGDWTVTAVLGEESATATVEVTEEAAYSVELSFIFYLFKAGTGLASGYSKNDYFDSTITSDAWTFGSPNARTCLTPSIELGDWSRCDVTYSFKMNSTGNGPGRIGFHTSDNAGDYNAYNNNFAASFKMTTGASNKTASIDLSSMSGAYYFAVHSFDIASFSITEIVFYR